MQTHLITYDLKAPGRDYARLFQAIKSYNRWAKVLESVWFVASEKTASEIRDHLKGFVDGNDKLLVVAVKTGWATLRVGNEKVTEWMRDNIA